MKNAVETATGTYLYAIMRQSEDSQETKILLSGATGIDGSEVWLMSVGRLVAVVSDIAQNEIRPNRSRLAAHHDILKRLMPDGPLLPASFGLIADDYDSVYRLLTLNEAALLEQLRRVEGKVEMGLRVFWDVPNLFEYIVNCHNELHELRDTLFRGGREPSRDEKIGLGQLFERALNESRHTYTEIMREIVAPLCAEVKENKPREEREVTDLACLVAREREKEFEQAVFKAARLFDDNFRLDYSGPWPPYNFSQVSLRM